MKQTSVSTSIGASGSAAAFVVLLVWVCSLAKLNLPADVAAAIGTLVTSGVHLFITRFSKGLTP